MELTNYYKSNIEVYGVPRLSVNASKRLLNVLILEAVAHELFTVFCETDDSNVLAQWSKLQKQRRKCTDLLPPAMLLSELKNMK